MNECPISCAIDDHGITEAKPWLPAATLAGFANHIV